MRGLGRAVWSLGLLVLCASGPAPLAAEPPLGEPPADERTARERTPAEERLTSVRVPWDDEPVSRLTVGRIAAAVDLISVAKQERAHVNRSAAYSWVAPGLGHYVNGETGAAIAFAATDVALAVTSAILIAQLLPPSVQSRNLNYLQSSYSDIEERWRSLTPAELIPATAVAMTSALLRLTVRHLAAGDARRASFEALRRGTIVFEPHPLGTAIVIP